ncbi:MobB [Lactiplantibacillus plantarum]|nr:MobB [Lactiplantibacillus plantarum]
MTENEQALVQLLKAYDNGEIDFTKVPAIQAIVRQEVAVRWPKRSIPLR